MGNAQEEKQKILDHFMGIMLRKGQRVNVFLKSGVRLNGFILDFDAECIALHDHASGDPSTMILRENIASITKDGVAREGL